MPIFLWNLIFITQMQWVLTLLPPDQECWQHSSKEITTRMLPTLLVRLMLISRIFFCLLIDWTGGSTSTRDSASWRSWACDYRGWSAHWSSPTACRPTPTPCGQHGGHVHASPACNHHGISTSQLTVIHQLSKFSSMYIFYI